MFRSNLMFRPNPCTPRFPDARSAPMPSRSPSAAVTIAMPGFPTLAYALVTLTLIVTGARGVVAADPDSPADRPHFGRDVRPILSDHCFACHGPDAESRKAGLRLDTTEGIHALIGPNGIDAEWLLKRVTADDPHEVMPPPEFGKPLSDEQMETLSRWVESGAAVTRHWAFVPPRQVEPPDNEGSTPIDRFLLDEIRRAGLEPTETVDRRTSVRRLALDLTGLPPSRRTVEDYLADRSPGAYERLVDRLLESPHHAEQMARHWLDLVRYGDTHGMHLDNYREMWPYRDWVIAAFAENMPYDRFLTAQLAGDLIPDATDADRIASGFNRLNVTTNEGGSIYDEVFARNVKDRTDAFGTVFLGLTTGCAACHDHKFDPLSTRNYYALSAFFNSLDGLAMDENVKDPAPVLTVPDDEGRQRLAEINESLDEVRAALDGTISAVDRDQRNWERTISGQRDPIEVSLRPDSVTTQPGDKPGESAITIVAPLPNESTWRSLRVDVSDDRNDDERNGNDENVSDDAALSRTISLVEVATEDTADGDDWIPVPDVEQSEGNPSDEDVSEGDDAEDSGKPGRSARFALGDLVADSSQSRIRVRLLFAGENVDAETVKAPEFRLTLSDVAPPLPVEQRVETGPFHVAGPFPVESAAAAYGRRFASQQEPFDATQTFRYEDREYGWQRHDDLTPAEVHRLPHVPDRASAVVLHQNLHAASARTVTLLIGSEDGHAVYLNGKQVGNQRGAREIRPLSQTYELPLREGDNRLYIKLVSHGDAARLAYAYRSRAIELPPRWTQLVRTPPSDRSDEQADAVRRYFRQVVCRHPDWLSLVDQELGLVKARETLVDSFPTTLIWKETETPRAAHVLIRGEYDQPGDTVERDVPEFLAPLPEDAPRDRLGLARWLVSEKHPLTARVAVNRIWQQLLGTGLVKTSEDFGAQGEPPSHPELLDHLAVEFRESGWDVRRLVKSIVMTDAYRRSAVATPESIRIDPGNRLLARGARYRLDAEVIRDQALAVSGLLVRRVGGPSVKPPQPEGLWYAVGYTNSNTARFRPDAGLRVYRRSLYTFWKRTSPPPQMSTFDAPSRESCTARRERTNTPLQALLLMNEPQFLEASRGLTRRLARETEFIDSPEAGVAWMFETVLARPPSDVESRELVGLARDLAAHYEAHPSEAVALAGESSPMLAAWTVVASTLLNLDETVTR